METQDKEPVGNKMSHFKYISKMFPSLTMIAVIFLAGFLKNSIRQEKLRKEEQSQMQEKILRENALIERENFLLKHKDFLLTFLEYPGQCNKIHALIYQNPDGLREVKSFIRRNQATTSSANSVSKAQHGDKNPLNNFVILFFFALMTYLLVRAIHDVYKELTTPPKVRTHFSLKDYAQSSISLFTKHKDKSPRPSVSEAPVVQDDSTKDISQQTQARPYIFNEKDDKGSVASSVLRQRTSISMPSVRRQSSFSQYSLEGMIR